MANALRGVREFEEAKKGDMIKFRNRLIRNATGLGPPDLCILYKK